ncbi:hypothetical protein CDAR_609251 [Caerostris darwini]|uniref:Uncharacterized protein n=1 Tax=Caerostris darwini TaxID=1538125 RepID=A0AAV4PVU0_9ARAC|nr:hypothetical protein CDAR_609251 [Caerostris darwini]
MANSVRGPRFWGGGGYLSFRNCPKSYLNCVGEENGAAPLRGMAPVSFAALGPQKREEEDLLFDLSAPEEEGGFN